MFAVESYAAVRRFVFVEGHSRREAARVFGLNRETVAKMCSTARNGICRISLWRSDCRPRPLRSAQYNWKAGRRNDMRQENALGANPTTPGEALIRQGSGRVATFVEGMNEMPKNLPGWERALRMCFGVALVAVGMLAFSDSWTGYAFACVGVIMLATGAVAFCPMCATAGRRRLDAR